MPTCPHCNATAARRAKGGTCPTCGKEVFIVRVGNSKGQQTLWVGEEPSTTRLLYFLEEYIKRQFGWPQFTFGDRLDRSRLAQLASAKKLLEKCDHQQRLAELVVDAYFDGTRRLWPPKSMHGVIGKQFQIALAIARKAYAKELEEKTVQQRRSEQQSLLPVDVFMAI